MADIISPDNDNDTIRGQQERDLGHPLDHGKKRKKAPAREKPPQHGKGQDRTPNINRTGDDGTDTEEEG